MFSIFILALMAFNMAGVYPTLLGMRRAIRRSVKHRLMASIPKSELSTLKFKTHNGSVTDTEFALVKADEFSYMGEMYDIMEADTLGETITFRCYADKKETSIVALLKQKIKLDIENSAANKKAGQVIAKAMNSFYLPPSGALTAFFDQDGTNLNYYSENKKLLVCLPVDTPPPKYLI